MRNSRPRGLSSKQLPAAAESGPSSRAPRTRAHVVCARIVGALTVRALMIVALMVSTLVCGLPGSSASAAERVQISAPDQLAVATVNQFRVDHGLPALLLDPTLTREAETWAAELVDGNRLAHDPDLAANPRTEWERLGENVGRGPDPAAIEDGFEHSPAHLANLLDPGFDSLGIAVVQAADGRTYVVQRFQQTVDTVAPGVARPTDPKAPTKLAVRTKVRRTKA